MIIGSRLLPLRTDRTYFHSGRAAFAYLIGTVVKPRKVYLPTFTCWSLVTTMKTCFPKVELDFYEVEKDLTCIYPPRISKDEALVFIHFFGHENTSPLPPCEGILIEDLSHSYLSQIPRRGHYSFGSCRKIINVADGGFIEGYYHPLYEPSRKLDSWLRLAAKDWRDLREAENMLDRGWSVADISSQSLVALLTADNASIVKQRQANDEFLSTHLTVGSQHVSYRGQECPMIHNRLMPTTAARDSLRAHLASREIYTSIHWPTHEAVLRSGRNTSDAVWLENHVISFPISHDYDSTVMSRICHEVEVWAQPPHP